jgi:hypothetical protein
MYAISMDYVKKNVHIEKCRVFNFFVFINTKRFSTYTFNELLKSHDNPIKQHFLLFQNSSLDRFILKLALIPQHCTPCFH